jgi:hypothetical protein
MTEKRGVKSSDFTKDRLTPKKQKYQENSAIDP